jgi:hypothetical protein
VCPASESWSDQRRTLAAKLAHECLDARLGEHVGDALRGHVGGLQREEGVEQPVDFGWLGLEIPVTGKLLQLAFFRAQAAAHRGAQLLFDELRAGPAQGEPHAVIGRLLMRQKGKRIDDVLPTRRLTQQREQIDFVLATDPPEQVVQIGAAEQSGRIAAPEREIEICMLAADETDDLQRPFALQSERPEKRRQTGAVETRHQERSHAEPVADMMLPGRQEIEPLIGRGDRFAFQAAPHGLCRREIGENLGPGNQLVVKPARRCEPRNRRSRVGCNILAGTRKRA